MDKRRPESSFFRRFFQEQLDHLSLLVNSYKEQAEKQQQNQASLNATIETIVDGTDTRIRSIGSYLKQLRSSAGELCHHLHSLVDSMPQAIPINQTTLVKDPLLNTIFKGREDVQQLFSNNQQVQSFFNSPENKHIDDMFILLFVTKREKNILGAEVRDGIIIKDVEQTHVSFYDHRLAEPCASEEEARSAMIKTLLECVVTHLKKHIVQQRHGQSEEEKINSAQNPDQNINNPEVYIKMLATQLSLPTELLKLHDQVIRLNKMGIKLELDSTESSNLLKMQALEVGEQCCQMVCIVSFPRSDLLPPATMFN